MNETILVNVLNEVSEEQKKLIQDLEFLTKAIEVNNEDIKNFQSILMKLKIEVPLQCFKPYEELIRFGISQIEEIVSQQPKEVLHEKRILLYPEGNRENFFKFLISRTIWTACIAGCVWILITVGSHYYVKNSENGKYKATYQWIYINSTKKNQDYLNTQYLEMQNDSIRDNRLTAIDSYLKKYPN